MTTKACIAHHISYRYTLQKGGKKERRKIVETKIKSLLIGLGSGINQPIQQRHLITVYLFFFFLLDRFILNRTILFLLPSFKPRKAFFIIGLFYFFFSVRVYTYKTILVYNFALHRQPAAIACLGQLPTSRSPQDRNPRTRLIFIINAIDQAFESCAASVPPSAFTLDWTFPISGQPDSRSLPPFFQKGTRGRTTKNDDII